MIVQEGRYYRDANGDKQGPMRNGIADVADSYHWYTEGPVWAWWSDQGKAQDATEALDLIAEWTEGPVRTVTRREVVEGAYGIVRVDTHRDQVVISIDPSDGHNPSAVELKAAAAVLLELAGALE